MEKDISDKELEAILEEKIKKDPEYYLHFLKGIIDRVTPAVSIDDESVFQLLRPIFSHRKKIPYDKLSSPNIAEKDFDLMPTSSSIDQLFYPWIRAKLKEWQAQHFDKRLKDYENNKGRDNIEKAFRSLIYKGQGRPRGISPGMKKEIIFDFSNVQRICNAISETRSWGDIAGRNDLIRSSFPDVGTKIITENIITNANQLRNLVLSERCDCSALNVEDFVRAEYSIFEYLSEYPDVESIDEDRQRIIITLKHGKRTIINK